MRKSFIDLDSDSEEEHKDVSIRVYVFGERKAGKTSFIKRMLYNEFSLQYTPTRSVEIYNKKSWNRRGLHLTLQFIDIPMGFTITRTNVDDIVIIFVNDRLPPLPKFPLRTWVLYRKETKKLCPNNRTIQIDNMANVGFDTFLNSVIEEFSP